MDHALVSAHGKVVALVAALLHAAGVTTTGEFARLIDALGQTVAETNEEEAQILGLWAHTVSAMLPIEPRH